MSFDRQLPGETTFERELLESARKDAGPHDVQGAWARFAGTLVPVLQDARVGGAGPDARVAAPGAALGMVSRPAAWGGAMKWLLLGAMGGSGLTASLMIDRRDAIPEARPATIETATASSRTSAPKAPDRAALAAASETRSASPADSRSLPRRPASVPRADVARRGRPEEGADAPGDVSSTLAAEVSRIDTARIASAAGDYDEAMRLVERYHRDFPKGALAPDADVVALEAAVAKHDDPEIARRASQFLSRYPSDPHAAHVQWLAHPAGR